jgi:LysR family hydrogen peroxide-inducible transcriptional activator
MNIHQFQYILAVAENRHFELAAEKCCITQSTLSTMISKFEDEIGILIFDRKKKPVEITTEGLLIIEQLKIIQNNIDQLKEFTKEIKGEIKGNLTLSVIPTIAPFLLPLFLQKFASKFPDLSITVKEQTTSEIIRAIKARELDMGIVSIPILDKDLIEIKLYDEAFIYYDTNKESNDLVSVDAVNMENLCLLEEGHCMRTQVIKLCDIHKKPYSSKLNFEYKAGSIDSLLRFVKANNASTLLPYLSTLDFNETEKKHVSEFSEPIPFRSVGIVVHRHFVKKKLLEILQEDILRQIAAVIPKQELNGLKLMPL